MNRACYILAMLTMTVLCSCHSHVTHPPATQPMISRPALDLKKAIVFSLNSPNLPSDPAGLSAAITGALSQRMTLAAGLKPVEIDPIEYPHLRQFSVILDGSSIDTGRKIPKPQPVGPISPGLLADHFSFSARPVHIDGATMNMSIRAENVRLDLSHDQQKHPILVLTRAESGSVECLTTCDDLSAIFKASANERGRRVGLSVRSAKVALTSQSEHQLSADLRLTGSLLLVPVALHFTAKVDVDDAGNAHLSHLTCEGDDVAGFLITQIIRPSLAKYNNRTMPLVAFPIPEVQLRQVRVQVHDQNIRVAAAFDSVPTSAPLAHP